MDNTVTPYVGQIQAFAFDFAPRGWLKCDGSLLSIASYNQLYSLIGNTYGGDKIQGTFAVPDLRGRSIVSNGSGPGLDSISLGQRGGNVSETLVKANLPTHNHNVQIGVNPSPGEESNPTLALASHTGAFSETTIADQNLGAVTQEDVGSNQPFNIRNPFLGVNVCIAVVGAYPARS